MKDSIKNISIRFLTDHSELVIYKFSVKFFNKSSEDVHYFKMYFSKYKENPLKSVLNVNGLRKFKESSGFWYLGTSISRHLQMSTDDLVSSIYFVGEIFRCVY